MQWFAVRCLAGGWNVRVSVLMFQLRPRHHASSLLKNFCQHSSHPLAVNAGTWKTSFRVYAGTQQNVNTNSLQWWQLNGSRCPRLLNMALKFLGIAATPNRLKGSSQIHMKPLAASGPIWNHPLKTCFCQKSASCQSDIKANSWVQ
jgi:hypothetical protein